MTLPNFVILGPPRTGTTWLFRCLGEHPQVFVPDIKEARFFDEGYQRGLAAYAELYAAVPPGVRAVGDITPGYFAHPETPERIARALGPTAKLFVIRRDPAERAYSEYHIARRRGELAGSFVEALVARPSLVENSLYAKQIARYLRHFPPTSIHVLDYRLLETDPLIFWRRMLGLLEVDDTPCSLLGERINQRQPVGRSQQLVQWSIAARRQIERTAAGRRLLWRLRDAGAMRRWHTLIGGRQVEQAAEYDSAEIFRRYFAADQEQLNRLLGAALLER